MTPQEELAALRRLAELEAKAKGEIRGQIENDSISQGARNFNADASTGQNVASGAGKALTDLARGAGQLVGMGPSAQETAETRQRDSALMRTGGGMAGNVAGNVAALAPLALAGPAAATVGGAGALGAMAAGLTPTQGVGERLKNMGVGFGLGAGSQYAGTQLGAELGNRAAAQTQKISQNAVRDETLRMGQKAGYVIPPSAVNPSGANKIMESVAGKAAVGQDAALRNQQMTDALARRAAGLTPDQALSEAAVKSARRPMAQPYRDVAAINPAIAQDLEALKSARLESKLQWNHHSRSGDPQAFKAAQAADAQTAQLENGIDQAAQAIGKPDLIASLRSARTRIAKSHDVERSLNIGTGSADASVLGGMLDRGAPLTGELETIGRMHQAFRPYMREGSSIGTPNVSKSAALVSALMGGGGMAAAGPVGLTAAAIPFVAPPAARNTVLSGMYQRLMATPNYGSAITKPLSQALTPERAALLARALAIPSAAIGEQR